MKEKIEKLITNFKFPFIFVGAAVLISVILAVIIVPIAGRKKSSSTIRDTDVKLGEYKGIKISLEKSEVTDEDVKEAAEWTIHYYNESSTSSRTVVEDKDTVYVTAEMRDEGGNPIKGDEGITGYVAIGSGSTYKELEQGLVGMNVGDTADITVTLPNPYEPDKSLSGKQAVCHATVQSIKGDELSLESLTDEQVKEAFGMETVDAFYTGIREQAEASGKDEERTKAYDQICEYLLGTCTVDPLPKDELEKRLDKYMKDMKETCETYYDMPLSEYCESMGMTESEYKKSLSENLARDLRLELIFTAIGDKEDIQYDEDAYKAYIENLIENNGYDSEEDVYEEHGEDYLKRAFRAEYVVDWLIEKADITYVPAAEESTSPVYNDEAGSAASGEAAE